MKLSAMRKETQFGVYTGVFYSEDSTDPPRLFFSCITPLKKKGGDIQYSIWILEILDHN